nr:protein m42.1 [Mastomys natalensis cytomegalovirus 3]WEG69877.1 protein m42.1 [Mastomys natalensis cytomegalovirus 3]WEG70017.1 protein m42.1 [Mastomys natalensis cytomegalovirus 3]WEG70157.1 protein m42.1 [Mastomys natalensis cytomegalovirus 3]WEG70297.1 protein m42.1 [Mastomys natalensis cytomegalovirus 3]
MPVVVRRRSLVDSICDWLKILVVVLGVLMLIRMLVEDVLTLLL